MRLWVLSFLGYFVFASALPAGAAKKVYIPKELEPWKEWVLEGQPSPDCPFIGVPEPGRRLCAWSSVLQIDAGANGAAFSVEWTVYDEGDVPLPGDERHWPAKVQVDGRAAAVTPAGGQPTVHLQRGTHQVTGRVPWSQLPKWLPLPPATPLVKLKIGGKAVPFPLFSGNSIGLGKAQNDGRQAAPESLAIRVYRKLADEVPFTVTTRVLLDVSGPGREVLLGRALLEGLIPMGLKSPLPARLEPDGRLRLQVKPGHWELTLLGRYHGRVSEVRFEDPGELWAEEEVWSFQANTALRLTELSNLTPIDPQQAGVPKEWKNLPAHRAQVGGVLVLTEKRRGADDPGADALRLQRNIWLDFDGRGYTFQDRITGAMNQGWRLNADPEYHLGRVSVGGEDQLITFAGDGQGAGVEIRQRQIDLSAVSRLATGTHEFGAVGWRHGVDSLSATLHLPPGYRLLATKGADRAASTWISRWTLLDLFILLLIAASVTILKGKPWGALALAAVGLIYHEPGAPVFVWLSILGSVALIEKLPPGKLKWCVTGYRNLSYLALVVIALPFMIDQARQGLYPQLEKSAGWRPPQYQVAGGARSMPAEPARKAERPLAEEFLRSDSKPSSGPPASSSRSTLDYDYRRLFKTHDPNANIQAGPGLPGWHGRQVALSWSGPVGKDDRLKLYLVGPAVNRGFSFLRIVLVAFLALVLFSRGEGGGGSRPRFRIAGALAGASLVIGAGLLAATPVRAEVPPSEILSQLKERLLKPPPCGLACFDIEHAWVEVKNDHLTLRLRVHAQEDVALPLPGRRGQWLPEQVLIDGRPSGELLRLSGERKIHVHVSKGVHQLALAGRLPPDDRVSLYFPHQPRRFTARAEGWELAGLQDARLLDDTLGLSRVRAKSAAPRLRSEAPPPFVVVERRIHFQLDWVVETRVRPGAPDLGAINLEVPLLAGEKVLSEHVKLKDGRVPVSLGGSRREVRWVSTLEKSDTLTLAASSESHWVERWVLDASALFHIEADGLPPLLEQSEGQWRSEYRPWPGEVLTLRIQRPQAVPGNTLAVDFVDLTVNPSARVTQSELNLRLRSSKGGQHMLLLPEGAELISVNLDGKAQPIRQEGRNVPLPLTPGTQAFGLKFKTPVGVESLLEVPRIDLGIEAANVAYRVRVPHDRWTLFVEGPSMGPAVLFWGELLVVVLLAWGLGRVPLTPLKTRHWILLGVAMSTVAIPSFLVVVGWLFALAKREELDIDALPRWQFNTLQAFLGLLSLAAIVCLFAIVPGGLLGSPDMHIVGNGSSAHQLQWYQDRSLGELPPAAFLSVPLLVYRIAMLVWALWMAFALLKWLQWGWGCISHGGLWRPKSVLAKPGGFAPKNPETD
jgi:hypothetical protein